MADLGFKFAGLLGSVSSDYLGIEFNDGNLRIAYIKSFPTKKEVIFLINKEIQNLSEEEVAKFITQQLSNFRIRNPKVTYIVPSHLVITRNVEVPSQDPKEIEDIMNLQASRHTPYGREEIITDFINIGVYRRNYTKILLVIVNRDMVRKQFDILRRAGFEPSKVTFSSEVITLALSKIFKLEKEQAPVIILHIDTAFTDFNILLKDKVIFVRTVPIGLQHLVVAKDRQWPRFIEEIKESLEVYRSEDVDTTPNRLILTGAVEEVKELASLLNDSLRIPAESISYHNYFSFTNEASKAHSLSKFISFLGVISPIVVYDNIKIDLTPQEARLKRLFEERSKEIIKTGILVLSIFVLIGMFLAGRIYIKSVFLNKLNKKFQNLHKQAEVLEKDFSRVKLIRDYLSRRGYSVEVLGELYKVLPDEIRILEVRFDRKGILSIKGVASSMTVIFSFVDDLNKSDYFKEVETKYTTKRKEADKEVADFEVIAVFRKERNI